MRSFILGLLLSTLAAVLSQAVRLSCQDRIPRGARSNREPTRGQTAERAFRRERRRNSFGRSRAADEAGAVPTRAGCRRRRPLRDVETAIDRGAAKRRRLERRMRSYKDGFSVAAYAVIDNDREEVLLTRRRSSDDWVLPGVASRRRKRPGRHLSMRCARKPAWPSSSADWLASMRSDVSEIWCSSSPPPRQPESSAPRTNVIELNWSIRASCPSRLSTTTARGSADALKGRRRSGRRNPALARRRLVARDPLTPILVSKPRHSGAALHQAGQHRAHPQTAWPTQSEWRSLLPRFRAMLPFALEGTCLDQAPEDSSMRVRSRMLFRSAAISLSVVRPPASLSSAVWHVA